MSLSEVPLTRRILLAAGAGLLICRNARAQEGPGNARALKVLVGYPAGGGGDTLVRAMSRRLAQSLQRPVIVDNKPGAGGTLAASALASSPADGSVVYMTDSSILVAPAVYEKLGYEPETLTPVLGVGQLAYCLVVHPSVPARNLAELIGLLKKSPGKYSYASPGVGNMAHLAAEELKRAAGVEMLHIPYKGGAPAIADLVGGQVPICVISLPPALAQAQAGKLRILATTTLKRWESFLDLPTISETVPGFEAVTNMFIVAPPKTPASAVDRLAFGFRTALNDAEIKQTYLAQGATIDIKDAEVLGRQMDAELKRWPVFARSIGLKPGV